MDEAERVTAWVGIDPESVATTRQSLCAESENLLLGLVQVLDAHIDMHLLRMLRVWPARCAQLGNALKRHPWPVRRVSDHHPIAVVLNPLHAQQFLVERRQHRRLRAVDHETMPTSDHAAMLPSR
jgi:hypothetical protein